MKLYMTRREICISLIFLCEVCPSQLVQCSNASALVLIDKYVNYYVFDAPRDIPIA